MKVLLYIYLFIIPFYPAISSFKLGQYSIITLLNLIILVISIYLFMLKGRATLVEIILFASIILSVIISLIEGWSLDKCLTNILFYIIPIFIYTMIAKVRISVEAFSNIMLVSLCVSSVLSILALNGILSKRSNYYINIYYVDGAAGIIGILLCLFRVLSKKKYSITSTILLGCTGFIVILLGQSRGRILTTIILVVMMIFSFLFLNKDNKTKLIKRLGLLFALVIIAGIILYAVFPSISMYVDNIIFRLESLGMDDVNVSSRQSESALYYEMFRDNLLFGKGWGVLNNPGYLTQSGVEYRAHNMYFGLLGVGGLLFCVPYYLYFGVLIKNRIKVIIHQKDEENTLGFISLVGILLLSLASAGFAKLSGILFMSLFYITMIKDIDKQKNNG